MVPIPVAAWKERSVGEKDLQGCQVDCEFRVPDEAFMAMELRPGGLLGLHGVVRYQPEFSLV